MDIVGLIAGLGIGGIAGVLLRAEHERVERRRDRMIVVAEEFLRTVRTGLDAVNDAASLVRLYGDKVAKTQEAASAGLLDDNWEENLREAATDALAALRRIATVAAEVDAVVPRMSLVFPSSLKDPGVHLYASPVGLALMKLWSVLSFGLSNPPIQQKALDDAHAQFAYAYGRFGGYANVTIWRRWYSRAVWLVRAGKKGREGEPNA